MKVSHFLPFLEKIYIFKINYKFKALYRTLIYLIIQIEIHLKVQKRFYLFKNGLAACRKYKIVLGDFDIFAIYSTISVFQKKFKIQLIFNMMSNFNWAFWYVQIWCDMFIHHIINIKLRYVSSIKNNSTLSCYKCQKRQLILTHWQVRVIVYIYLDQRIWWWSHTLHHCNREYLFDWTRETGGVVMKILKV